MNPLVQALFARLSVFDPSLHDDHLRLCADLESAIVHDDTDFDNAALLSRALEDFTALLKNGSGEQWVAFRQRFGASEGYEAFVDVEVLLSFLADTTEHLTSLESRIAELGNAGGTKAINEVFRIVHTIKGVSGFLNLIQVRDLSHEVELLLDDLRSGNRALTPGLCETLLRARASLGQMIAEVAQRASSLKAAQGSATLQLSRFDLGEVTEEIKKALKADRLPTPVLQVPVSGGEISDLLQNPELVAKFSQEALETLEVVESCLLTMEKTHATGDHLHEAFRAIHTLKGNSGFFGFEALEGLCMESESLLDALRKGIRPVDTATIEILLGQLDQLRTLVNARMTSKPIPNSVLYPTPLAQQETGDSYGKYTVKKKDIRVDTEKLDGLFDLIGELITAEAMVIDNPDLRGLELGSFAHAGAYLSKITRELQSVTMSIRMIPLEGLFSKMQRLVRDLGRKFGKAIELDLSGSDTEMDRNIIEEISDPLVHIIRNAIDHGIEDTAVRVSKGKVGGGRIGLNARYEGNEIWITISDDGAGLDRERILSVARARGLIGPEEPADQEVWRLIFEPGFSTATQVSEISGRGVGMDVVKKNLEKLRGVIDIQTVKDEGTHFILKIPLTLAILDGVTLRAGSILYSIPIADVVEFQNFLPELVTQTDPDHRVLRLRDEVLPVLPLTDLFPSANRSQSVAVAEKPVAIVVKSQGRKMAVIVDEIVGYKQIVLKSLPESMSGLQGISGCTILGNGEVSLIIDVNALFQRYLA